eukprot:TRINITY_DN17620_c0_g3_i1.p1 TRINITY_DN17620_c0_g3~~TRINITY_DN17620_c0_g3_i1.p1  ORF type:complete len:243 (+),score=59.92 TRINITY_DN17620_c0_g3_i1:116-844(+)
MKGTKRIKKLKNAVPKESCNTLLEKKAASLLKNSRHKIRKHKKGKVLSYITEVKEDCIHSALQEARECGNESSISIKKDEIKENILHTNNDAEINFQKSEKQLDWFISLFQASCNTRLSSLELQEIPEKAMIKLPKSLDHQEENLSKHVKYIFGPKWKEVLCKPNLEDDILPGSPVLLVICSSAIRCMDVLRGLKELTASCHAAKLFAKHIKIEQQVEALKNRVNIAVGTPSRLFDNEVDRK